MEVVQLLGLQGFWQHQVLRGSWWLGQQEVKCTRRVYTGRIHTKFISVVSSEDTGRVIGLDWS